LDFLKLISSSSSNISNCRNDHPCQKLYLKSVDHQSSFSRKLSIEEESWDVKRQLPSGSWTPFFLFLWAVIYLMETRVWAAIKKAATVKEKNQNERGKRMREKRGRI
jgi:hypothetical protein